MKNRALIALVTVVIALFGGYALTSLKQELAPDIQFPQLAILTSYPGASPAVVTNDVSTPIEAAIQGVPDLQSTSAVSSTNQSLITAMFTYGSDLDTAEQKIDQAISNIKSTLPANVQPQVLSGSISDLPVIELAVSSHQSESALAADLTKLALPEVKNVTGVDGAQLIGAAGDRVTITPDPAKLASHGLTTQSITSALAQNGILVPGGSITEHGKTLTVQAGSQLTSIGQLKDVPLIGAGPAAASSSSGSAAASSSSGSAAASASGPTTPSTAASGAASPGTGSGASGTTGDAASVPTIGDVATVVLDTDPMTSIARVNGKPALTIAVTKLPSANTVAVSKGVRADIRDLEAKLGNGATITVVFDQAPFIEQSISSLAEEGLLGLGFAVIVILLFLLSVRATIVTAISIPTSVLITFIGILAFGYTLNIITLGGLTIAIGRVVDDSIVVIENIKRHLVPGADRAATVLLGVREVAGAITASTITTVAVFLPIAFVGDVTGELFRPFALTVTIALLSSLLVALTIVPVLAYWFVRAPRAKKHEGGAAARETAAASGPAGAAGTAGPDELDHPTRLQRGYLPIIHWTLRHSALTIVFALIVLAGSAALIPHMQTNFLGSTGQNTMTVTQTLEPGASLQAQDEASRVVEKKLLATAGIETVQLSIGSSGNALEDAFSGGGGGITFSVTTDSSADQIALQNTVENELKKLHGVGQIAVSASSGFGVSTNLEVDITASTQSRLQTATDRITRALERQSALKQVSNNLASSLPYLAVVVDRQKAAAYGLTEVEVSQIVSQAMQPTQVGTMSIDQNTLDVYVKSPDPPTSVAQLSALPIPTGAGPVALDTIASVTQTTGPATITTQKGLRSSAVTATPATGNLSTANAAVSTVIADTKLPPGATAVIGGVTSSQGSAFSQLGVALLAAILIVYTVMVATFRSLRQPLLLLVSIPFAATGAILLQVISGIPLGVASLVGVLMLIGIVVTNAIVLVDLVNQYRRRGRSVPDAVLHGASRRLRPILMTALATIFALVPMAFGVTGGGGFISQPLAIVVIGGLVTSTLLTLIVLPTLYNLVEGARDRARARRAVRDDTETVEESGERTLV
jgi:HAE1 family hydrophobic/amphiphilic exporter-1